MAGARTAADFHAEMASLKREFKTLTDGTFEPSPALKKLRDDNAKLVYQLESLRKGASSSKLIKAEGAAVTVPAAAAPRSKIDLAAMMGAENNDATAVDMCSVLTRLFEAAVATAFPMVEQVVLVSPNTGAGTGRKGGKGKGKGKKSKDKAAEAAPADLPSSTPMYQCADAMKIFGKAKKLGLAGIRSPMDVAQRIVECLPSAEGLIQKVEAAGGFINISICRSFVNSQVGKIIANGVLPPPAPVQTVTVDFSSPNIAKIMHVGHLRSTIIGESISRLLEFLGHKVIRMNHVGDWGTQFGMLIANLKDKFPNFKDEAPPIHDLLAFYKESKKRSDEDPDFKQRAKLEVVALQSGEPDVTKAWQLICDVSRREYEKVYKRLEVSNTERGESFYQSRMVALVKDLHQKGLLVRGQTYQVPVDEDSTYQVVAEFIAEKSGVPASDLEIYLNQTLIEPGHDLTEYNITPKNAQEGMFHFLVKARAPDEAACSFLFAREGQNPLIVQKTDGGFGYHASDLACIKYRVEELKSDWIVYVVDAGQSLHFQQVFAGAERMGLPVCPGCVERNIAGSAVCRSCAGVRIDHVAFGVVQSRTFGEEKQEWKVTKFKTREGDTVSLQWLLDEGVKQAQEFRIKANAEREARNQDYIKDMELSAAEAAQADEAIAYSCIKYADLSHDRIRDYVFSFDAMLSPKGDTAVYLINAYARIKQVLQKPEVVALDIVALVGQHDIVSDSLPTKGLKIAEHLVRFPERVARTATALMPNYLCEYLYELASMVHEFYSDEDCRVLDRKNGLAHVDRVLLFAAAAAVMERCFHIIGLRIVDKM
mmetsp:Transcript_22986/g.60030  ORF Transcript_22986/g.60030 Transcript_22986/m.60030 type:complete len:822 (+) Transcript_22986:111-2576(+)|eukprot:CAMPEP_0182927578 /NCGR_PEP_ID=MMETSP0105_2-20130417/13857_1 /TAXON_ID=81532 ORGANISM="Acanthoeca-like sp., Strain 10tr" /NCGR_SAMPLE_ID=MMETSP0105_2 /ASSEMBLY_ACC=CAM_ASM_000205 /LENGTH=821 /DNA_ID=CAMNT_0025065533 /DNA_START=101 /DNA_END=2566 /DNA_ORIENTATION=+